MRQLSLFKGKRQRGRKPPPPLEFELHCVVADIVRRWISSDWRFTHLPFGEHRHPVTAVRLRRMGVTSGWPDFVFVGPQRSVFWLELKRRGMGRLSETQAEMASHLMACGFGYLCTSDVNDAVTTLKDLGILRSTFEVQ
ncbi:hypothetical protein ACVJMY_006520 [Bradyrhizobium diazoefficiens]